MKLTRRRVLALGATQAAVFALAACGGAAAATAGPSADGAATLTAASPSREAASSGGGGATSATMSGSTSGTARATLTSSVAASSSDATGAAATSGAAAGAPSAATLQGLKASLTGAGSTFDNPLFSKLFDEFHRPAPAVTVNYQSIGSGGGVKQLTEKTVDFGASDFPLSADQEKALPAPVLHVPITLGATAIGYNLPGITSGLKLSGPVLAGIYLGEITAWNDPKIAALNPDLTLPATAIAVVHRNESSGTTFMFTSFLAAVSDAWKNKVGASGAVGWPTGIGAQGSAGVAGQVKQVPGGIGYFELAYATQNSITVAAIQNKDGNFVAPSPQGASAAASGAAANMPADLKAVIQNPPGADAYPISGFSWVLVYQAMTDEAKAPALANLLAWLVTDGQQYGPALEYAALPEQVVRLDLAQLRTITLNGTPVLG